MDNEEAKFILQSFRPDGADASDPAFAQALAVAAEDREVGEWLARERATDAAFAAALGRVAIPDDLRESILAVLAGEQPGEFSEMDAVFVGALASVQAPEGLRDQILTAMKMESEGSAQAAPARTWNWLRTVAVAAAVVLGAFFAIQMTKGPEVGAHAGVLKPEYIEQAAISRLEGVGFELDAKNEDPQALFKWLKNNDAPTPMALPAGLSQVQGIGCKILKMKGEKTGALVCFELKSGQVVHMVTLDRADVVDGIPNLAAAKKGCKGCHVTGWSSVAWSNEDQAFVLMGKMKPEELASVF